MTYLIIAALLVGAALFISLDNKFYTLEVEDTINAPLDKVWFVVAQEFANIHLYSEHVESVEIVSEKQTASLGCIRRCTLKDGGFMQEEITFWKPNKELGMRSHK